MELDAKQRREDLERKIRGLLKKAESTDFPEEADAFIRKATEMMIRHSIDEETIWKNDPDKAEQIEERVVSISSSVGGHIDKRRLFNHIAKLSNCHSWWNTGTDQQVVCGYTSDILWVEILYASIVSQAQFKQAIGLAVNMGSPHKAHTKVFKSNWWYDFVEAVCERLTATYGKAKETYKMPMLAGEPGSMELVLRDRKQRVDDYVNSKYKFSYSRGSRKITRNASASALGRMAGNEVDLSGGKPRMGNKRELNK